MALSENKKKANNRQDIRVRNTASFLGLVILFGIGLLIFLLFSNIKTVTSWLPYNEIVEGVMENKLLYKIVWIIKDFSEGQFYGGLFAGIGLILGAIIAWQLDIKNSSYAGIRISYGLNIWPWVFASQILTMLISVFILQHLTFLDNDRFTWLPTFLFLVGAPQAVMCTYGPSKRALFTGSILGALLTFPIANWIAIYIMEPLDMPNIVSNYFALASAGTLVMQTCSLLPWMEKKELKLTNQPSSLDEDEIQDRLTRPDWIIRRTLADFTDPLLYGNEIATSFLILGAMIDWFINSKHGFLGSQIFPAVLFSQLLSGGVAVYLYGRKHLEDGWYPTYIPVVSIAPFCVINFGPKLSVILFSSILGGIIGPPFAGLLNRNLPDHLHGYIPNVLAMGITTIFIISTMNYLPWF